LLDVSERQLRSWEKQNFVSSGGPLTFSDLLALRTLLALRKNKVPAVRIRQAVAALRQRLSDVHNPLTELRIYSQGTKIQVQFAGQTMEPITGQLLLDFDQAEINKLLSFPGHSGEAAGASKQKARREAERWFEKGLELEQTGAPVAEIVEAYRKAAEIDPTSAGALVNLGTVYFNARDWGQAEHYYRNALEVDPEYALAHFNLGNLFDERGERQKALGHYLAALRVQPHYADAHYNVALLYQSIGQPLKAVRHWKLYLKVDPSSSWSTIARRELGKLKDSTIVRGLQDD
jgi:tetratricopeptide (TPR) repeat protein